MPGHTLSGYAFPVERAVIPGGAAGAHRVPGLSAGSVLLAVARTNPAGGLVSNLTGEFSVTGAEVISNVAGTATTGDFLAVMWRQAV